MKDAHEILSVLSTFPLVQLVVLGVIVIAGWYVWVSATKTKQTLDDGNRIATLFDISKLRADVEAANSERGRRFYAEFDMLKRRISRLEGGRRFDDEDRMMHDSEGE